MDNDLQNGSIHQFNPPAQLVQADASQGCWLKKDHELQLSSRNPRLDEVVSQEIYSCPFKASSSMLKPLCHYVVVHNIFFMVDTVDTLHWCGTSTSLVKQAFV